MRFGQICWSTTVASFGAIFHSLQQFESERLITDFKLHTSRMSLLKLNILSALCRVLGLMLVAADDP